MSTTNTLKFLLGGIAALVLAACSNPEAAEETAAPAPPQVSVAQVVHERITEWDEFTGRLQAPQTVQLIPRVSGYIEEVHFNEGALVDKGDLLVQIDPKPFATEVARLKAELQSAQSAAVQAEKEYRRAEKLSSQRAISAELLDSRLARKQQTAATVASVEAALERAELDLSYTRITAPISGRVSYAQVTAGNFVSAGQSQITSLVSTEKMYAYFDVDEQSYLKYARLAETGKRADTRDSTSNPVYMALANDSNYQHVGRVDFVDNRIDAQTGTIRVRASFPNDDNDLLPGLFARIRLVGSDSYEGILIDEKAVGTDLNNKFVLVVNSNNELEYRAIELGEKVNGLRIVTEGLTPKDKIVVNGLQRVRANMKVDPQLVPMASSEQLVRLRKVQQLLDEANNELTAQTSTEDNHG
ncbi:TPA: efflux RND transporter periplasmic adaptor subunit [Morganella morganii subsp. morganii]|uniref:Efflux pump periplasmic linker BepF n=1 Tax=Vreelandella titanicae TaxID=664683 RepID=A0AAP9SYH9_9GAMM|nr:MULTISPECIES: efflux RND transporter periplasmic adaptor subunit [Gammaproteobacteria]MAW78478.1 MexE family multidrug efflux RND transporter periplasmic adaptor subunit [Planctomycetota bacterium]HAT8502495.1 efflux RND transporter periplasmic adaptor subunit [Vibrio vulnificus]HDU8694723.1 efflux RND transporter periplasmic adaptor subunit [Morganella morganii subsp. morganii]MBM7425078.1 multidrug efflux system membrane fusion protein [Spongiibacter marinus]QKS22632.1 Efflux pump peripla|tara:strand:- start:2038 stop:3279 length:1242 start_codon:yes stop_codon:yes gene_type:complete